MEMGAEQGREEKGKKNEIAFAFEEEKLHKGNSAYVHYYILYISYRK